MKYRHYQFSGSEYWRDPDLDTVNIQCPVMKQLTEEYTCMIPMSGEDWGGEIHYFTDKNRAFFSMHDNANCIYLNTDNVGRDQVDSEYVIQTPWIQAIFTARLHRGKGIQSGILKRIVELCELHGTAMGAVCDPFRLKGGVLGLDCRDAFMSFTENGYTRQDGWCDLVKKQIKRFRDIGFQNYEMYEYSLTEAWQHYLYIPETAVGDYRKVLESNLKETIINCT